MLASIRSAIWFVLWRSRAPESPVLRFVVPDLNIGSACNRKSILQLVLCHAGSPTDDIHYVKTVPPASMEK